MLGANGLPPGKQQAPIGVDDIVAENHSRFELIGGKQGHGLSASGWLGMRYNTFIYRAPPFQTLAHAPRPAGFRRPGFEKPSHMIYSKYPGTDTD
jgi:hypothetical protein